MRNILLLLGILLSSTLFSQVKTSEITRSNGLNVRPKDQNLKKANQPIVLMNGIETNQQNLDYVSPESIESVSVFKGKVALEKYGRALMRV